MKTKICTPEKAANGHMLYLPGFLGLWLGYVFCDLTKCSGEGKSIGNLNIRSKSAIMTTKINFRKPAFFLFHIT